LPPNEIYASAIAVRLMLCQPLLFYGYC